MSDIGDSEQFNGLTQAEALQLCVRHAGALSLEEVDFVQKLGRAKKPMGAEEVVRLRGLVARLQAAAG